MDVFFNTIEYFIIFNYVYIKKIIIIYIVLHLDFTLLLFIKYF